MTVTRSDTDPVPPRPPRPSLRPPRAAVPHRNLICAVGDLVGPIEPRTRTDGMEVLTFRVSVRIAAGDTRDASAKPGDAAPSRRDVLDCVVAVPGLRRRLEQYQPGDVVEVEGALRHRFWNAGGRVQSRYEIEVARLKRLARDRAGKATATTDAVDG